MAIKFVRSGQGIKLLDRDVYDAEILALLKCTINQLRRVELQLEKLTDDEIDCDDGKLL